MAYTLCPSTPWTERIADCIVCMGGKASGKTTALGGEAGTGASREDRIRVQAVHPIKVIEGQRIGRSAQPLRGRRAARVHRRAMTRLPDGHRARSPDGRRLPTAPGPVRSNCWHPTIASPRAKRSGEVTTRRPASGMSSRSSARAASASGRTAPIATMARGAPFAGGCNQ